MEVWKDVKDYVGIYKVSNYGRVKSFHKKEPRIIKPGKDKDGYLQFCLSMNGNKLMRKVHRKVAETFIHNIDNKKCVNHINGIKDDNRVENLEWCTNSENMQHAKRSGLINQTGSNSVKAKLTLNDVDMIRKLYKENKIYQKELAKIYNVSQSNISKIILCKSWREVLYVKETKETQKHKAN
jgi:hypothetical protein